MGEAVGNHVSLRLFLQPVIADRGGCPQRLVQVAGLEQLPFAVCLVSPETREAVGLEFLAYR